MIDYSKETEIAHLIPAVFEWETNDKTKKSVPLKDEAGAILAHNLPVQIPTHYVKELDYDGDGEIFAALDIPIIIDDEPIEPPSMGVFSLLETLENPFLVTNEFTPFHVAQALYINRYRRAAAPLVHAARYGSTELDVKVTQAFGLAPVGRKWWGGWIFEREFQLDVTDMTTCMKVREWFAMAFNGFAMIRGASGETKWWYGAEAMGSKLATIGEKMGCGYKKVLWDVPMALVGHVYAGIARNHDCKVARPKDEEDRRRQFILAYLRETAGELHPWQRSLERNMLTALQIKHGGQRIIKEFAKIKEAAGIEEPA